MEKGDPATDTYPDLRFSQWKVINRSWYKFLTPSRLAERSPFPLGSNRNRFYRSFSTGAVGYVRTRHKSYQLGNLRMCVWWDVSFILPLMLALPLYASLTPFFFFHLLNCVVYTKVAVLPFSTAALLHRLFPWCHRLCDDTWHIEFFHESAKKRPKAEEVSVMKGSGVCRKNNHGLLFSQDFQTHSVSFMVVFLDHLHLNTYIWFSYK